LTVSRAKASPGEALGELIAISRAVGGDPDLVQGGGGNTSIKSRDGRRMLVKASGAALADVDETRGWAELDLASARGILILDELAPGKLPLARREREVVRLLEAAVLRSAGGTAGARPSVDASLHALLGRVVIHVHPVGLNALLSSRRSATKVAELVDRAVGAAGGVPLYVPYADPGFALAVRVREEIERHIAEHGEEPRVVLLENHGLFVSADDVEGCLRLTRRVVEAGTRWAGLGRVNPRELPWIRAVARGAEDRAVELRGALLRAGAAPCVVRRDESEVARRWIASPRAAELARKGPFTPDQVFYCGAVPLVVSRNSARGWERAISGYRERRRIDPRVVVVPGDGVYYCAPDLVQLKVVSEVYRGAIATFVAAARNGGPRFLTRAQARFIEEWEVEVFRRGVASGGGGGAKPLAGRVGVVTGAASGLGKGIALGLIQAGATVVACDVDRSGLEEVRALQPAARYLPLACDVTREDSVRGAFAAAVASTGGIDYLVNAAGIAPSYDLVDFPLAAWQKSLDINLTGYFLCAREAARWMLRQGAGGAIVNLTSKSGLEASKSNSAYNATKAGEIHLMRGWALELGRAGIRVNCVAPGNVFKGSRIWNAEYIRACARKKGIRPEEVISYYTAQSALGKEIEPEDIASAVVFLFSDAARNVTGQTLVVDGGQVMVR
jgi:NAD(P)-dependent dehydrogenase (short-subunit alcohol dehydrogenase family)/rhamnose utilization protein RhaD (predicted bifunctional aldolase and dehydrogenase)